MDHYDDENFDDGFDEEALAARMKLDLWKKLFAYVREYPRDLTLLGTFAFTTACADITFPLITRAVVDDVSAHGAEASLLPWAFAYLVCAATLALSIGGFIWMGGKIRTHVSHDSASTTTGPSAG